MSDLPANWTPPRPPEASEGPRKTAWKSLLITLMTSGVLMVITCAGGLSLLNKHNDMGVVLSAIGLLLGFVFLGSLAGTVVYFFIWLVYDVRAK